MNREKAIEIFKRLKENAPNEMHLETVGTAQELFEMAIQALSQELCDDAISREFIEITTHYPPSETCIYPEYKGKPYYSIKYCENGKTIVGYGTYSIEVLTRYLKEYFLPSVTRQTGEWTDVGLTGEMYVRNCKCTNCGKWNIGSPLELPAYCGICGAKMTSDKYMLYGAEPYKAESEDKE